MKRKKPVLEDDGRTVADMSGITRQNLLLPRLSREKIRTHAGERSEPKAPERPWEEHSLSRKESLWYALGALKAALVIALVFIVGSGLVVLLFLWMGNAF